MVINLIFEKQIKLDVLTDRISSLGILSFRVVHQLVIVSLSLSVTHLKQSTILIFSVVWVSLVVIVVGGVASTVATIVPSFKAMAS